VEKIMRKLLVVVVAVIAMLVVVLLYRASSIPSLQPDADPAPSLALDASALADRLGGALRYRTISHQDPGDRDDASFAALRGYLERTYPRVHDALSRELVAGETLFYTWKGTDASLDPALLLAHLDVVPVEPGTESAWEYPPFSGSVAGGYVWGRGSLDDKVNVVGVLEAAEHLIGEGFRPRRTVLFAFGHDEELGGPEGAQGVAALLEERGTRPAFVLDEGGAVVEGTIPGVPGPAAIVGIAEKGYVSVELEVEAEGGHSSTPPPEGSIGILAEAVRRLERNPMPARIVPPVRAMFEAIAPEAPFAYRLVFSNLWLFRGLVIRTLEGMPVGGAMVRTTTAPTLFHAGVKDNVVPSHASAVVNFRILPGDTVDGILEHVRRTVDDDRVRASASAKRREAAEPSRVDSDHFRLLARTIREIFPDTIVAPYLVMGGTDARHFQSLTEDVYRFMPFVLSDEDMTRIHGTNERVSVEGFATAVRFFVRLLRNAAG
jgi:carboxypeptidase PM20D1